jgi:hypothetical protein
MEIYRDLVNGRQQALSQQALVPTQQGSRSTYVISTTTHSPQLEPTRGTKCVEGRQALEKVLQLLWAQ